MSQSKETIAAFRFGLGFAPGQRVDAEPAFLTRNMRNGDPLAALSSPVSLDDRMAMIVRLRQENQKQRESGNPGESEALKKVRGDFRKLRLEDARRLFERAIFSDDSFFERLSFFWADHFTVAPKVKLGQATWGDYIDNAIRANVTRSFADMLIDVVLHPNMLLYLDQRGSVGPESRVGTRRGMGLNENLAREILELHTLGVGGAYSQTDVRQLAELLTGLSLNKRGFMFAPGRSEPGPETILGRTYGDYGKAELDDIRSFLHDVSVHPDTARHIARKLAVHFVSDEPDPDLIATLADTYMQTDGDLPSVYVALLDHPAAWMPLGAKVKQPMDFMISGLRALGLERKQIVEISPRRANRILVTPLAAMGQPLGRQPGPDGWPEEAEAWITAHGLAARLQWSLLTAERFARRHDPRAFLDFALRDLAGDSLRFAVSGAEKQTEGIALVLASPEFNRR
ncbi:MAG: DUF1800 domain-containing protein [Rhodobacteraceae bacterium]|nr:DUF1800 domain-containing protein [Paracoccaceae bacterium]